jgi:hypothetical protein
MKHTFSYSLIFLFSFPPSCTEVSEEPVDTSEDGREEPIDTSADGEDLDRRDVSADEARPPDSPGLDFGEAADPLAEPSSDFCTPPSGNILAHGEFEEGMSGLAPAGWEVRNPDIFSTTCFTSPESYLSLGAPPYGCSGHSLAIDAGGTWDCYAIQTVSDYFTIEEGHTYRVSAVVRSSGNSVNPAAWFLIGVQWVNASDGFFGDEKNPPTSGPEENDFDWKLLSFDLVAPPEATRILVWLTAHYPARVEYDNVSVVRVDG